MLRYYMEQWRSVQNSQERMLGYFAGKGNSLAQKTLNLMKQQQQLHEDLDFKIRVMLAPWL